MFNVNGTVCHRDRTLPSHNHNPDGRHAHWASQGTMPREMGERAFIGPGAGKGMEVPTSSLQPTVCFRAPVKGRQLESSDQSDELAGCLFRFQNTWK